jgi:predicted dehydrogenase
MTIRIGLVGCGRWGKLILRDLVANGASVGVVCHDPDSETHAREYGASSIHAKLDDLPVVDGYVVATPSSTHAQILDRLVDTGRPIYVEKPLTTDPVSARRLAVRASDRLFVMDKWRYHPAIEAMRQEILSGRVGEVLSIRTERWQWGNPHQDTTCLWILAPHDMSIVQHLIGSLPPLQSVVPMRPETPYLGLTAQLREGQGPTVSLSLGVVSPSHRRHCLVVGTKATMELRGGYETMVYIREGSPCQTDATERTIRVGDAMPLFAELQSFLGWIAGGSPPMSSVADALVTVERIAEIEVTLSSSSL